MNSLRFCVHASPNWDDLNHCNSFPLPPLSSRIGKHRLRCHAPLWIFSKLQWQWLDNCVHVSLWTASVCIFSNSQKKILYYRCIVGEKVNFCNWIILVWKTSVPRTFFYLKELRRFWFAIGLRLIDFLLPLVNSAASLFLVKSVTSLFDEFITSWEKWIFVVVLHLKLVMLWWQTMFWSC